MLTPTLAYREVNEKAIDDELMHSYEHILYSINDVLHTDEKNFRQIQNNFGNLQMKEDALNAIEWMTTLAKAHDTIDELRAHVQGLINQIRKKYEPKNSDDEEFLA